MTYRQVPNHGKTSTAAPAKRSKQVSVRLQGGPRHGDLVNYGQPLPKVLVIHGKTGWRDYYRKSNSTTYVYGESND